MLLSFQICRDVCHAATSPEIKQGKDEHPDKINEVPVQAGDFDYLVMSLPAREKAAPFDIEIAPPNHSLERRQENPPDRYVGAMKSGDHEKARTKLCRAPRVAPGTDALHEQFGPFESL